MATSERRRIRLKADFHYFALRGASIRRSQRSNSEAVLFRGTLPRRYSIKRSRCGNNEGYACVTLPRRCSLRRSQRGNNSATPQIFSTTFAATPISTYLSCVETARRFSVICPFDKMITANNQIPCLPSTFITLLSNCIIFLFSIANNSLFCSLITLFICRFTHSIPNCVVLVANFLYF